MCRPIGQVSQLTTTLRRCQKYETCFLATLRSSRRHAKENNMHSNSVVVKWTDQRLLHLPSGFEHIRAELQDIISDGIVQKPACSSVKPTKPSVQASCVWVPLHTDWVHSINCPWQNSKQDHYFYYCYFFLSIISLSFLRNNCWPFLKLASAMLCLSFCLNDLSVIWRPKTKHKPHTQLKKIKAQILRKNGKAFF